MDWLLCAKCKWKACGCWCSASPVPCHQRGVICTERQPKLYVLRPRSRTAKFNSHSRKQYAECSWRVEHQTHVLEDLVTADGLFRSPWGLQPDQGLRANGVSTWDATPTPDPRPTLTDMWTTHSRYSKRKDSCPLELTSCRVIYLRAERRKHKGKWLRLADLFSSLPGGHAVFLSYFHS
ncbi:uncharacterized protein [Equus przewalskii]|uniref:Uncharacterized protein n=1 Tax=Equus przewalskii TaxID=9798 RepID=A0ABM4N1I8_EQUPR